MWLRASVVGALIFVSSTWVLVDSANEASTNKGPLSSAPPLDTNDGESSGEEEGTAEVRREQPEAREHPLQPGRFTGTRPIRDAIQRLDPRFVSLTGAARRIIASWMIAATECLLVQSYGQQSKQMAPFYLRETAPGADAIQRLLRDYNEKKSGKGPSVLTNPLEPVLPLGGFVALSVDSKTTFYFYIEEIVSTQPLLYKVRGSNTLDCFALRAFSLPENRADLKKLLQQQKNNATAYTQLMKFVRQSDSHRSSRHFRSNLPYAFGTLQGTPHKTLDLPNGITMLNFFIIEDIFQAPLSDFSMFLSQAATVDPAMAEAARLSITIQVWMLIAHFRAEGYLFQSLKASDFAIDSLGLVFVKLQSGLRREAAISRRYDELRRCGEKKQQTKHMLGYDELKNSYELARVIVGIWCDEAWQESSEDAAAETQMYVLDLDSYETCLPWETKSLVEQLQSPPLTHTIYTHSVETLSVYARLAERLDFAQSLAQIRAS